MDSTIGKIAKFAPHVLALSLTISLYSYYFATQTTGFQVVQELGEPFDVLIIGGGAAGLSAATTLYRHQHDIRIFDYDKPRNVWDTLTHALPGWEGNSPSRFREASRKELQHTGMVDFVHSEVETVEKKDDNLFYVTTADGKVSVGRKILLSMGVSFKFPDIPGYLDNFPERIFHCLFTFGYEHRGASSIGVLAIGLAGNPMHANILVDDARKFSENVTVYTNGDRTLAQLIKAASVESNTVFDERKISRLVKGNRNVIIEFETGETSEEAVLIHQPFTEVNPTIVEQLNLKLNERGDIVTRMPFYHTNTPGVFAAGDCASPFKIIANAVLMGANAGAGIARELPVRVTGNRVKRLPLS